MVGGSGYLLSAFVVQLAPNWAALGDVLTIPATVGEVWMVGYLLVIGVRHKAITDQASDLATGR